MWFKVFVLLRLPLSVVCLLGYATTLSIWNKPGKDNPGAALFVGVYVYLAFTSIKLFRLRKSARTLAGLLLALETIGAVLLQRGGEFIHTHTFEPVATFTTACVVIVVWTLPNALILYNRRAMFAEDAPHLHALLTGEPAPPAGEISRDEAWALFAEYVEATGGDEAKARELFMQNAPTLAAAFGFPPTTNSRETQTAVDLDPAIEPGQARPLTSDETRELV